MAEMRAPDGRVLNITDAGVAAMEALGWTQTTDEATASGPETGMEDAPASDTHAGLADASEDASEDEGDDTTDAKPAAKRTTRKRS